MTAFQDQLRPRLFFGVDSVETVTADIEVATQKKMLQM